MSFTFLTGGVLLVLVGKKALVKEFIAGIESFIGFLALFRVRGIQGLVYGVSVRCLQGFGSSERLKAFSFPKLSQINGLAATRR